MSDINRPRSVKEILTRINKLLATDAVSGEVRWLLETQRELAENLVPLLEISATVDTLNAKIAQQEQQIQELLSWRTCQGVGAKSVPVTDATEPATNTSVEA